MNIHPQLLKYNPEERMTLEDLLVHPWINQVWLLYFLQYYCHCKNNYYYYIYFMKALFHLYISFMTPAVLNIFNSLLAYFHLFLNFIYIFQIYPCFLINSYYIYIYVCKLINNSELLFKQVIYLQLIFRKIKVIW